MELTDRILEILRGYPYGLTAKEIAERLGVPAGNISSRVSKLAAYGVIEKTRGRTGHNVSACAIIMLRLPPPQPIPFRGSTKPRHTAKPSKIRDVNFFATQRAPS
jgi:DNA-binding Lrp family transcriptional regulator